MNEEIQEEKYELNEALADAAPGEESEEIESLKADIINTHRAESESTGGESVQEESKEAEAVAKDNSKQSADEVKSDPEPDSPSEDPKLEDPEAESYPGPVEEDTGKDEVRTEGGIPVLGNTDDELFTIGLADKEDGSQDYLAYVHAKGPEHAIRMFGSEFGNVSYRTGKFWDPRIDGKPLIANKGDKLND